MRFALLSRALLLAGTCSLCACAIAPATTPLAAGRPEPVIADRALDCSALMTAPGVFTMRPLPTSGWLLVQYSLDGSGKAQQVEVLDSDRAKTLAKDVVSMVRTASYRQGEVRVQCREVIAFHVTRG